MCHIRSYLWEMLIISILNWPHLEVRVSHPPTTLNFRYLWSKKPGSAQINKHKKIKVVATPSQLLC